MRCPYSGVLVEGVLAEMRDELKVSLLEVSLRRCPRQRCPCSRCPTELPGLEEVAMKLDKDSERIMLTSS